MGGNALKLNQSTRLDAKEYFVLEARCLQQLKKAYPFLKSEAIKAYRSKESFGDLDLLVESTGFNPAVAAEALGAVEVVRNGPVTSFGVLVDPGLPSHHPNNVFQVDLITIKKDSFDYALNYFNFNDCGNLVGRLAHSFGLSHGHEGLYYYFRDGDYKFKEFCLTTDYSKALSFLGYNPADFDKGFETLEEMFEFVVASSFFNPDIFLLHNRNAQSRVRDKKRPSYTKFLKYCEVNQTKLFNYQYPDDKKFFHQRIEQFFPGFLVKYAETQAQLDELRLLKTKFNGELVQKYTGFQDKDLGQFMAAIKNKFESPENLKQFMLSSSDQEIKNFVLTFATQYQPKLN